jgi:hypothetical protein
MDEPTSKTDLKDAISDINRFISELTRDIAIARAKGNNREADRLTELKLQYMKERGEMQENLTAIRRSRYDE